MIKAQAVMLRALSENGRRRDLLRQWFPKESIIINMDERLALGTIGIDLTERPPTWVMPVKRIQSCGHFVEVEAQLIHQQTRAFVVRHKRGARVMLSSHLDRQDPRQ